MSLRVEFVFAVGEEGTDVSLGGQFLGRKDWGAPESFALKQCLQDCI